MKEHLRLRGCYAHSFLLVKRGKILSTWLFLPMLYRIIKHSPMPSYNVRYDSCCFFFELWKSVTAHVRHSVHHPYHCFNRPIWSIYILAFVTANRVETRVTIFFFLDLEWIIAPTRGKRIAPLVKLSKYFKDDGAMLSYLSIDVLHAEDPTTIHHFACTPPHLHTLFLC